MTFKIVKELDVFMNNGILNSMTSSLFLDLKKNIVDQCKGRWE